VSFDYVLQLLNLPILGGVVWIIFRAGRLTQKVDDHDRRINNLERRSHPR
jgi:hypothetical protein